MPATWTCPELMLVAAAAVQGQSSQAQHHAVLDAVLAGIEVPHA